jgi:hypothetical protein
MQGLIGWRCGIVSPVAIFREAIGNLRNGLAMLKELDIRGSTQNLPFERASFLEFLVRENPSTFDFIDFVADRLLDAILGVRLQDEWDQEKWDTGLDQLRKIKGSALALESYSTYIQLLQSPQESNTIIVVEKAISLFEKRKSNSFFSGGDQTDGGGMDNSITVDYRLAAILAKIGYKSNSIHSWLWS